MASAIAERLGVPVKYVPFAKPGELADAAGTDAWDIGLIGAEPARAEKIAFTAAYVEIEATYLVPAGSPLQTIAEVDRPGIRIAVSARSAYDLWLERNIKHATLVRSDGLNSAVEMFVRDKLDALAGCGRACWATFRRCRARGSSTAIHRGAAGDRHGEAECGGRGVPERVRGGGEEVRAGREADREARCGRPAVGGAARIDPPRAGSGRGRDAQRRG